MFTQAFLTATTATTAEAGSSTGSVIYMAVSIGLMIAVFYLFLSDRRRKRTKKQKI
jgi:preprotein translocase subunit YajC